MLFVVNNRLHELLFLTNSNFLTVVFYVLEICLLSKLVIKIEILNPLINLHY